MQAQKTGEKITREEAVLCVCVFFLPLSPLPTDALLHSGVYGKLKVKRKRERERKKKGKKED